jgi:stringent starvation protein B
MELCKQLQQQQQQESQPQDKHSSSSSSSSAGWGASAQLIQDLCAQASSAVVALVLSEASSSPDNAKLLQQQQQQQAPESAAGVAESVLSSAAAAPQLFRQHREQAMQQWQQQHMPVEVEARHSHVEQHLSSQALAEQLRVLGGALVLQFVSAAAAAGGPAWQQEVPLQAVVLFGALEQMQGMALAAVQQQDVQDACTAATTEQQDSQQQQQQQQQQQEEEEEPAGGLLLLLVQKLLDIIHLTRQFAQLNAALNSSWHDSSGGSSSSKAVSSSSSGQALSCEALFSPGGPVHALHPEPATLGGWTQPAAAAATAKQDQPTSNTAKHDQPDSNSSDLIGQPEQSPAGMAGQLPSAASSSKSRQRQSDSSQDAARQLRNTAVSGALLLFHAQQKAQSTAFEQWRLYRQQDRPAVYSGQTELLEILQHIQYMACRMGIILPDEAVLRLLRVGSAQIAAYRSMYEQQLEAQGLDPCWATPLDAADEAEGLESSSTSSSSEAGGSSSKALASSSTSSSSGKKAAGRTYGAYGAASSSRGRGKGRVDAGSSSSGVDERQQQQEHAGVASAIKAAGSSIM